MRRPGYSEVTEVDLKSPICSTTDATFIHIRRGANLLIGHIEGVSQEEVLVAKEWELSSLADLAAEFNAAGLSPDSLRDVIHHRQGAQWRCVALVDQNAPVTVSPELEWEALDASLTDVDAVGEALAAAKARGFSLVKSLQYRSSRSKQYHCVFLGVTSL